MSNIQEIKNLMQQFCYTTEAICFVEANYERYLPALATLANHAAKVIEPSYYELKHKLVNEIAKVATSMGWRTFETYDGSVESYPYVFYVDSGIFPQVSFHSEVSRATNSTRGKWSGKSVQEIAFNLIKNRLKKDGFKGEVLDLKKITHNIVAGQMGGEADHLYKGQTYKLIADSEGLWVLDSMTSCVKVESPFYQSFISRFSKNQSPEKTIADCEDNQSKGKSEQTNSIDNDTDAVSAESQSGGDDTHKQQDDFDFDTRESISAQSGAQVGGPHSSEELGNGELIKKANTYNQDGEPSKGMEDFDAPLGDLDTNQEAANGEIPQGDSLEKTEDSVEADKSVEAEESFGSPTSEVSGDGESQNTKSQNTKGFFDLLELLKHKKPKHNRGGGAQLNRRSKKTAKPSLLIQEALLRLAGGKSLSQKIEGQDKYCEKKLVKALTTSPHKLMNAKFDRPADKVYFFVDTSGSVATFGKFIISMIKSAENSPNIEVWSGSEAHPETNERTNKTEVDYKSDFAENLQDWIDLVQPQIGSTLVFWGDLQGANIVSCKLKKVCQNYKTVWLQCATREETATDGSETEKIKLAGFKVIYGVQDEKSLAKGINSIM